MDTLWTCQSLVVGTSNAWWHGSVGRAKQSYFATKRRAKSLGFKASPSSWRTKFPGKHSWWHGSVGSARHSHCRGQGFDSPMLHKKTLQIKVCKVFSCSFFSRSEYADTAQLPLVYYSRVFFCRVRSLPSVSAGPYTPGEYSANSSINSTVQPYNRL